MLEHLIKTISFVLRPFLKNYVYTVRHGIANGLERKGGLGFIPNLPPLKQEEKFLMNLDLKGQTIYDIGGFEGIFTIFFARAVGSDGKVITFEPNPMNYKKIIENVKLNKFDNVRVLQIGLGEKKEKTTLAFEDSELAIGSIQKDIKNQILRKRGGKSIDVEVDSLDNQIKTTGLPQPDFIKIDVEGLEMEVLVGMSEIIKKYKPKLFIEIHGIDIQGKIENVQRVVEFLVANTYSIYHVESKMIVVPSNAQIAKEGHLYCNCNKEF